MLIKFWDYFWINPSSSASRISYRNNFHYTNQTDCLFHSFTSKKYLAFLTKIFKEYLTPATVSPARQLDWRCLWLQSLWCCATGESLVALKLLVRKDMLGLTECPVVLQCFNISQSFTLSVRSATELCWLTPAVSTELVHTESHWVFINLINWIRIMIIISFLIIYHF